MKPKTLFDKIWDSHVVDPLKMDPMFSTSTGIISMKLPVLRHLMV